MTVSRTQVAVQAVLGACPPSYSMETTSRSVHQPLQSQYREACDRLEIQPLTGFEYSKLINNTTFEISNGLLVLLLGTQTEEDEDASIR